jgi:hypothetical protein
MLTKFSIRDETTASLGRTEHTFTVHVSGKTISQWATQETEEINNRKPAAFHTLVRPTELHQPRLVDLVTQHEKAIEAFEGNGFITLVDDQQIEDLEDPITLV